MMRISCLLLCFVLFSLCNSYSLHKLKFRKRVDPDNVPNQFNLPGMEQFSSNDSRLVEGDILASKKLGRNAYIKAAKWPNGIVPYEIGAEYTTEERKVITDALAAISAETNNCIKFVRRTANTPAWVSVYSGTGCNSYMGYVVQNGAQKISLQRPGCVAGSVVTHEFLHALGFAHEQSRPDRDRYVKIFPENIQEGFKFAFDRFTTSEVNTLGQAYDYGSIMHYRSDAFTTNGKPTILPSLKGYEGWEPYMGRGDKMSRGDVTKLKIYYECP